MIASIRFEVNNTKDKMKIKGALDVGGRMEIFDLGVEGIVFFVTDFFYSSKFCSDVQF